MSCGRLFEFDLLPWDLYHGSFRRAVKSEAVFPSGNDRLSHKAVPQLQLRQLHLEYHIIGPTHCRDLQPTYLCSHVSLELASQTSFTTCSITIAMQNNKGIPIRTARYDVRTRWCRLGSGPDATMGVERMMSIAAILYGRVSLAAPHLQIGAAPAQEHHRHLRSSTSKYVVQAFLVYRLQRQDQTSTGVESRCITMTKEFWCF